MPRLKERGLMLTTAADVRVVDFDGDGELDAGYAMQTSCPSTSSGCAAGRRGGARSLPRNPHCAGAIDLDAPTTAQSCAEARATADDHD
jgi:hypothetical protein